MHFRYQSIDICPCITRTSHSWNPTLCGLTSQAGTAVPQLFLGSLMHPQSDPVSLSRGTMFERVADLKSGCPNQPHPFQTIRVASIPAHHGSVLPARASGQAAPQLPQTAAQSERPTPAQFVRGRPDSSGG